MIEVLVGPVAKLLDKFIPDAGEKARLAHEIATLAERQAHEIALAQIEVNKEEAKSEDPEWLRKIWKDKSEVRLASVYWMDLRDCFCIPLCWSTSHCLCYGGGGSCDS